MNTSDIHNTTPRLKLNGPVPDFDAITTQGQIRFSTWAKNKWVILFSHPADFTPVCTTEFIEFAKFHDVFERKGVLLLGCSVDSVYSHIAWARSIEEKFGVRIRFPVISDTDQRISRLYGMLHEPSSNTSPVRCVYFIGPNMVLRAMIYYPMNVGRNYYEIMRVIDALQMADEHKVACPANWMPGEDVIIPAPVTLDDADKRLANRELRVTDWYFAKKLVA